MSVFTPEEVTEIERIVRQVLAEEAAEELREHQLDTAEENGG